ncbi:MAG: tetratricopeptide repeat protein [candidate division WOR-3 bacterium]|nr:tetratricopeptide repeat protein [candidate division WOR-3 bacterium]MDW8150394.1 tetratricopeptide repeat protein [candidate division WOR-3 bacterium]
MLLFLLFQIQEVEEHIETEFISEVDKIQKPLFNINDSLYKNSKFDMIIRIYRNTDEERKKFILAEAYYYKRQYQKANELYNQILKSSSDSEIVLFSNISRSWILYHQGLYNLAIEQETKDSLLLTLCYIKMKDYSLAYSISKNYSSDTFLFLSGFSAYLLKSYDLAINSFEKLIQNYPNSSFTAIGIYRIGIIYLRTEFYDRAIKYFTLIVNNYKQFKFYQNAIYLSAYSYYKLQNYEKSYEYALMLIKNYPNDENTKLAKNLIKEIYLARPEIVDSTTEYYDYLKAYKLYKEDKCYSAIEVYKVFINSKEKRVLFFFKTTIGDAFLNDATLEIGECYMKVQNYKEAVNSFRRCKLDECSYKLGISLYLDKNYSQSIIHFEKLLKNKNFISKIPEIYYYLGLNYLAMNKRKKAEEYLNKSKMLYIEMGDSEKVKTIESILNN